MGRDWKVRAVEMRDLDTVLSWRNHPDVRRYMLSQHEITESEHLSWFKQALHDNSRSLLIIEDSVRALGFVHFSGIKAGGVADWGFYAVPGAPHGTGFKLCQAALFHAYEILVLHKVCGQTLDFNTASIKLHEKLGFKQEGVLRQQAFVNDTYHDIICYGLLRDEWLGG